MVELRQRLGLGLEPLHKAVVLEQLGRKGLQRNLSSKGLLHRAVHDRHAAPTEAFDDLVAADPGTGEVLHSASTLSPGLRRQLPAACVQAPYPNSLSPHSSAP